MGVTPAGLAAGWGRSGQALRAAGLATPACGKDRESQNLLG